MQAQLPPRPDCRSYIGSSAGLAADAEFAEPGGCQKVGLRSFLTPCGETSP
jgi:hypothetical protein